MGVSILQPLRRGFNGLGQLVVSRMRFVQATATEVDRPPVSRALLALDADAEPLTICRSGWCKFTGVGR